MLDWKNLPWLSIFKVGFSFGFPRCADEFVRFLFMLKLQRTRILTFLRCILWFEFSQFPVLERHHNISFKDCPTSDFSGVFFYNYCSIVKGNFVAGKKNTNNICQSIVPRAFIHDVTDVSRTKCYKVSQALIFLTMRVVFDWLSFIDNSVLRHYLLTFKIDTVRFTNGNIIKDLWFPRFAWHFTEHIASMQKNVKHLPQPNSVDKFLFRRLLYQGTLRSRFWTCAVF